MKLKGQLSGVLHELALSRLSNRVGVDIDDRHYDVEVQELGRGEYLLKIGVIIYKCRIEQRYEATTGESFEIVLRRHNYNVTIIDPKRLRSGQSAGGHQSGAAEIVSPMPGKIVRVLVAAGDNVEAGAGIIVVEAMKMQNEMKAPKAGIVVSINAEEGATVNAGDVMAVVE